MLVELTAMRRSRRMRMQCLMDSEALACGSTAEGSLRLFLGMRNLKRRSPIASISRSHLSHAFQADSEFVRDAAGKLRMVFVEKGGESIEVSQGVDGPFEIYRSCHGRNWAVPQVRNQWTRQS